MYVLKYRFPCPERVTEHSYEESPINVVAGVAVVQTVTGRDYLLSIGYDLLGEIKGKEQLQAFLVESDTPNQSSLEEHTKIVSALKSKVNLSEILGPEIPPVETKSEPEYWWQKEDKVV